jgi:hypothetical protein
LRRELKERGFAIMAEPQQYAWQQLPGESPRAFQAFVIYRNTEPKERSLQRVASELAKSIPLVKRWSSRWDWVERVREWDDYQEMRRLEKLIEEKQKMDEEHLRIIRAARSKAIKALADIKPEQLATNPSELRHWIMELIRYERLIMGEPETIEVLREKIAAQATIEERLKAYAPVFQELLDEGAIRLDGYHDQSKRENGGDEVSTYDEPEDE